MSVPQGQGPLNDPRLVERRGDLSGLNALMFAVLVIVAFAAAGVVLWTLVRGAAGSTGPTATPTMVAAATETLAPTASPSPKPSSTTASPTPTVEPTPPAPVRVVLGANAPLTINGVVVGRVTVLSATYKASISGRVPPKGDKWLTIQVWYEATAPLSYDASDWVAIDGAGDRQSMSGRPPKPALGKGTLKAGGSVKGNVTFAVALNPDASSVILTSPAGTDMIIVTLI